MITVHTAPGAEFQHIADKAREVAAACQGYIEAQHAKRGVPISEDTRVQVNMEITNLVTQVALQALQQELGVPRPALVPGVAMAAGMVTAADVGRSERGRAVAKDVSQSFMDCFVQGFTIGLDIAASR